MIENKKRVVGIISILIILIISIISLFNFFANNENQNEQSKETEWNWANEDIAIYTMLQEKYTDEKDENYPLVMLKNQNIPKKQKDEKRILIVGDSMVYGYADTNINYTWWKQLNLKIKEAGYSNVNVYAAGRYFLNTKDELEKILKNEKLMEIIDPDLIVIGYIYNDPEEREKTNRRNLVLDSFEVRAEESKIYQKSPTLYYELVEKVDSLDANNYEELKSLGDMLGFYRWDLRQLIISEGERLERYKVVLKEVDDYMKKIEIPYFYLFLDNVDNPLVRKAFDNVYNVMQELKIKAYYDPFNLDATMEKYNLEDSIYVNINPVNPHPGIIWAQEYGKKTYNILKQDYNFLFESAKYQDINELELNINDTMPFLKVEKISKNIFEFEYPKKENVKKFDTTNFLYYPLEKDYIKLNLEYPKNVKKIIVISENLEEIEIYVNTIDEDYGFDINEAKGILTMCKKIKENMFEVNAEITSINIYAKFYDEENRNIKIEFIE